IDASGDHLRRCGMPRGIPLHVRQASTREEPPPLLGIPGWSDWPPRTSRRREHERVHRLGGLVRIPPPSPCRRLRYLLELHLAVLLERVGEVPRHGEFSHARVGLRVWHETELLLHSLQLLLDGDRAFVEVDVRPLERDRLTRAWAEL